MLSGSNEASGEPRLCHHETAPNFNDLVQQKFIAQSHSCPKYTGKEAFLNITVGSGQWRFYLVMCPQ